MFNIVVRVKGDLKWRSIKEQNQKQTEKNVVLFNMNEMSHSTKKKNLQFEFIKNT